jgi:hypothetical protein
MGLSEFPDTLSSVILHFGSDINDRSGCGNISLICRRRFFTSPFDKRLYLYSRHGLVMVDLLNNFLNPLKLFLGCGERFFEIAITENGGGKARKINGRTATANQE